jgi:transcriptional regulator of acetoin/glycerol metabolism
MRPPVTAAPLLNEAGALKTLAEVEAFAIRFALAHHKGALKAAARSLGVSRSTLWRKLRELPPLPAEAPAR